MGIDVKILDIEVGSEYNDVIYDQWISVELPNGGAITVFDDQIQLSDDAIDTTKHVELSPIFNNSEVSFEPGATYGIQITDDESDPDHIYTGRVDDISHNEYESSSKRETVVLDVGCGTITFSLDETAQIELTVNDEITLRAFRTDVTNIE